MGKYVIMDLEKGNQVLIRGHSQRDAMKTFLYRYSDRNVSSLKEQENIDIARFAVIDAKDMWLLGSRGQNITEKLL